MKRILAPLNSSTTVRQSPPRESHESSIHKDNLSDRDGLHVGMGARLRFIFGNSVAVSRPETQDYRMEPRLNPRRLEDLRYQFGTQRTKRARGILRYCATGNRPDGVEL